MNKNILVNRQEPHTPEWFEVRRRGIGASEIAASLAMNPYTSRIRLCYEKVGLVQPNMSDNEAMFHGRYQEDYISKIWKHWDVDGGYIENYKADKVIRECRNYQGIFMVKQFPWLFVSPDRLINKGQFKINMVEKNGVWQMERGAINQDMGALEIKTISGFSSAKWEGGIPPGYVFQVHGYFIILGIDYGEIAVLKDGRNFFVLPVYRNETIINAVITQTKDFWYNTVLPMRDIARKMQHASSTREREALETQLQALEPAPDGSDDYKAFMSERFREDINSMEGSQGAYDLAIEMKALMFCMKMLNHERRKREQQLIKMHIHNNVRKITFEIDGKPAGYTAYYKKGKNKRYQLGNFIKVTLDEVILEDKVKSLLTSLM